MNLEKRSIIVYDFETNALLDDPNFQPIEFAAIKVYSDGKVVEHNDFIRCPTPLSKKTTELTGIKDNDLIDGITLEQLSDKLADIFGEDTPIVTGHNIIKFDNIALYNLIKGKAKFVSAQCFDTAGHFKGKLINWTRFNDATWFSFHKSVLEAKRRGIYFNLTAACKHYDIIMEGPSHRAIVDVRNNLQLLIKQFKELDFIAPHLYQLEK